MYRKYTADRIFTGYDFVPAGSVLIMGSHDEVIDLVPMELAGEDIRYLPGLLMPGMVNAHCHIELSHLQGKIPMHTGLTEFVQQVMQKREASGEQKMEAMMKAEQSMLDSGTVAVGDICNTVDSIPIKLQNRLHWHHFIEVTGFVPSTARKRFEAAEELADCFRKVLDPDRVSLVPHAPYSVSPELFSLINQFTDRQLISLHNQETQAENQLFQSGTGDMLGLYRNLSIDLSFFQPTGKSSLQSWLPWLNRGQRIIAVHNTFIQPEDLDFQAAHREAGAHSAFYYCICPGANLYIENRTAPLHMLAGQSAKLLIGTDSLASNQQLNMWEEIRLLHQHHPEIPESLILQWATINGAEALGIESRYGSFERGKRPGLVQVYQNCATRIWD